MKICYLIEEQKETDGARAWSPLFMSASFNNLCLAWCMLGASTNMLIY